MNRLVQLCVILNAPFLKHNLRVTMKLTKEENQSHCLEKTLGNKDKDGLHVLAGHPVQRCKTTMTKVSFM